MSSTAKKAPRAAPYVPPHARKQQPAQTSPPTKVLSVKMSDFTSPPQPVEKEEPIPTTNHTEKNDNNSNNNNSNNNNNDNFATNGNDKKTAEEKYQHNVISVTIGAILDSPTTSAKNNKHAADNDDRENNDNNDDNENNDRCLQLVDAAPAGSASYEVEDSKAVSPHYRPLSDQDKYVPAANLKSKKGRGFRGETALSSTSDYESRFPSIGEAPPSRPQQQQASPPPANGLSGYSHILEAYDFDPSVKQTDLDDFFRDFTISMKWVDDTHALIIFTDAETAEYVLASKSCLYIPLRAFQQASPKSKQIFYENANELGPPKKAPKKSAQVAMRLISSSLDKGHAASHS